MDIVAAQPEHLDGIARIYRHYVETSPATFDLVDPDPAHWRQLLADTDPDVGYFFLVALDDDGDVVAYAYSRRFRDRAAYDTTCETSVYVDHAAHGRGIGKAALRPSDRAARRLAASPRRWRHDRAEPGEHRPARIARASRRWAPSRASA